MDDLTVSSTKTRGAAWLLAFLVGPLIILFLAAPAHALTRSIDPSDGTAVDNFGASVAVDGDTLVVGAPFKGYSSGATLGAVYVYTRTGETWTQSAKLTASDGADGDLLGTSVAIDGNTIVAGAPGDDIGAADDQGSIYLFDKTGAANRTQREKLIASDGSRQDALGNAVDIDGGVIVVGVPAEDTTNTTADISQGTGALYTFAETGAAGRNQSAKLTITGDPVPSGCAFCGARLGDSVAIDGDIIVAGASIDSGGTAGANRRGAVFTFDSTGASTRSQTAKLTLAGTGYGRLGVAVDVQGDTILGADDEADSARGAVYSFTRTGAAARNETGKLTPANRYQNYGFGQTISMSSEFIAIGSPSYGSTQYGGAYVFTRTGAANRNESWFTSGNDPQSGAAYGKSIATDGDRVIGGAPNVDVSGKQDQGRVYSSVPSITVTKQGAGAGTISSTPVGINNCSSSCDAEFVLGQQVTLTATPGGGSNFAGWSNFSGCSGTAPCTFTVTGGPQIVGTFNVGPPDTTPPNTTIGSGPANGSTVTTSSVTFGFTANELSTFECAYDSEGFAPCTQPGPATGGSDTRSGLSEGAHTFKVRAKDTSNNTGIAQSVAFSVDLPGNPPPQPPAGDTSPPETTITEAPPKKLKVKKSANVKVEFSSSEPGSTFGCRVDGGPVQACSSPASFKLGKGSHTITIAATDASGNVDSSPATVQVEVKKKKKKRKK